MWSGQIAALLIVLPSSSARLSNQSLSITPPPPFPRIEPRLFYPANVVPSRPPPFQPPPSLLQDRATFLLVSYKCQVFNNHTLMLLLQTFSSVLNLCLWVTSPLSLMPPPQIKAWDQCGGKSDLFCSVLIKGGAEMSAVAREQRRTTSQHFANGLSR